MADSIIQAGYHKFTTDELIAGTRNDIVTTDASTNLVIRSIEATQGQNANAITAEATIGLTSGLAGGDFTSLGTVAKADRVGAEGNVIMPASSTLSIRPSAKSIIFNDEKVFNSNNNASNFTTKQEQVVKVNVAGRNEPTLNTGTQIDKTSVTYGAGLGYTLYNYPNNYTIYHTNSSGLHLRIMFYNYTGSQTGFDIWNADTGTFLGGCYSAYQRGHFDGSRYIYFLLNGGTTNTRIKWIDLEESETNLTAANTTGGGNYDSYWHGQTAIAADSPNHGSNTTNDNMLQGFYQNPETGKKYFIGYAGSATRAYLYEIPDTLTNDSSTTPAPRWQYLSSTSYTQTGTDPFGNNSGNAWNIPYTIYNYVNNAAYQDLRLTYDTALERYLIFYNRGNKNLMVLTFTAAEMESGFLTHGPMTGTNGLMFVSESSASNINVDSSVWKNVYNYNAELNWGDVIGSAAFSGYDVQTYNTFFVDGMSKIYFKSDGTDYWQVHYYNPNDLASGPTKLTSESDATTGFDSDFAVFNVTPTTAQRSSRTYTQAPGLKVRVTAVQSDQ